MRGGLSWANLVVFQPPDVGAPVARAGAKLHQQNGSGDHPCLRLERARWMMAGGENRDRHLQGAIQRAVVRATWRWRGRWAKRWCTRPSREKTRVSYAYPCHPSCPGQQSPMPHPEPHRQTRARDQTHVRTIPTGILNATHQFTVALVRTSVLASG